MNGQPKMQFKYLAPRQKGGTHTYEIVVQVGSGTRRFIGRGRDLQSARKHAREAMTDALQLRLWPDD